MLVKPRGPRRARTRVPEPRRAAGCSPSSGQSMCSPGPPPALLLLDGTPTTALVLQLGRPSSCRLLSLRTVQVAQHRVPGPREVGGPPSAVGGSTGNRAHLLPTGREQPPVSSPPRARSTRGTRLCQRWAPGGSRPSRGDRTGWTPRTPGPARAPWPVRPLAVCLLRQPRCPPAECEGPLEGSGTPGGGSGFLKLELRARRSQRSWDVSAVWFFFDHLFSFIVLRPPCCHQQTLLVGQLALMLLLFIMVVIS